MNRDEYNKIKSEFKKEIVQICKEKKIKYEFLHSQQKMKKDKILKIYIRDFDKLNNRQPNVFLFYGEYWLGLLLCETSKLKIKIESIINRNEDNFICNVCYEKNEQLGERIHCSFLICKSCTNKTNK